MDQVGITGRLLQNHTKLYNQPNHPLPLPWQGCALYTFMLSF
jgi:hypothetical protein